MNKIKINVYVICYNESYLAPWAIDYWKRYANHVYIYDNGSNDGCLDIFKKYPDFITVRHYETNGKLSDLDYIKIKNNVWKESKDCDFVAVGDFDEMIFSDDLESELQYMKDNGMTLCCPRFINVVSLIKQPYIEGQLLHQNEGLRFCECILNRMEDFHKISIFDPNKIKEINYEVGCHECMPEGDVVRYDRDNIFTLHMSSIGVEHILNKNKANRVRLSQKNIDKQWGTHYNDTDWHAVEFLSHMYRDGREEL